MIRCPICDKPSLTGTPGKCATCTERGAYETSCCGFAYADEPCTCATTCQVCGEDRDGYEASPKDAKVVDPTGFCESCHESAVRVAKRDRAQAAHEAAEENRGIHWSEA